uniref:CSON004151 protein n=1 Tax=Culicoides sonorensis TaxID=179676 RepID=A0A336MN52_CULSO
MSGILKEISVLVLLTLCIIQSHGSVVVKPIKSTTDSYLAALIASKATDPTFSKNRREDNSYPVYNVPDSFDKSNSNGYDYKPPSTSYGQPIDTYVPPASSYGGPYHKPPQSSYGPPSYAAPVYLQAPPPNYVPYGPPAEESSKGGSLEKWLLEKIKFKIDFYTIGKILLKLVIFKKIVKFIGLICLLMFIPTLKKKLGMDDKDQHDSEDSEDSEERLLKNSNAFHISSRKLDDLTLMLTRAIETFAVQGIACTDDDPNSECKFSNIYNRLLSIEENVSVSSLSSSDEDNSGESKETTHVKNASNEVEKLFDQTRLSVTFDRTVIMAKPLRKNAKTISRNIATTSYALSRVLMSNLYRHKENLQNPRLIPSFFREQQKAG